MCFIRAKKNKQFIVSLLTCLGLLLPKFAVANVLSFQELHQEVLTISTQQEGFQIVDSTTQALSELYETSLKEKDTVKAIRTLRVLARSYSHEGNHKETYDKLWTALLLADASKIDSEKAAIYKSIGRHYSFYKREEKAFEFLNLSHALKKKMVRRGDIDSSELVESYLSFVSTYREMNDFEMGQVYLDSCKIYKNGRVRPVQAFFLAFEEGALLCQQNQNNKAIALFENALPWFEKNIPGYKVLLYNYMGDAYKNLKNYKESEHFYQKALFVSKEHNAHKDFTPLIYERLSELYVLRGDFPKAFENLKKAKELDAVFFDSRSENNRPLLEIQDSFRNEKETQAKILREQRLAKFEHEEKVLFLEKILLWGFIVFLLLFGFLTYRNLRAKHQIEKQLFTKKRELEIQKNEEVIELKNKELAASVLKLIEKDAFIGTVKDKLSDSNGDLKSQDIKKIIRSISSNNNENWNEFEARFVSINKSFYENLQKKFPKLTVNDQKLCALIKLNFSSKDMARLLNMSIESVHTTRSRLRKKLELSRDINLKQFIANI